MKKYIMFLMKGEDMEINVFEWLFELALALIYIWIMRDILLDCIKAFKKEHRWKRIFKQSKLR